MWRLPSAADRAWAAGLFEGEGSIFLTHKSPTLALAMSDKDVVERFARLMPIGRTYEREPKQEGYKKIFGWTTASFEGAQAAIAILWPNLGDRRRGRALQVLSVARETGVSPKYRVRVTECVHGHPYTEENTYIAKEGHKVCRPCRRAGLRRWYEKKMGRA